MKRLFPNTLAATLLALAIGFGSCGKDDDSGSQPTATVVKTATITGNFFPIDALTLVTATNSTGQTLTAVPRPDGSYALPRLAADTYVLSFQPADGYLPPADLTVVVAQGQAVPVADLVVQIPQVKGRLEGQIRPVCAMRMIAVTNEATMQRVEVVIGASPDFAVRNIPKGTYKLEFFPNSGYAAVGERRVVIAGGTSTNIGVVEVPLAGRNHSANFQLNGVCPVISTQFSAVLTNTRRLQLSIGSTSETVSFVLEDVVAAGSYPFTGFSTGKYQRISTAGTAVWTCNGLTSAGSVNITSLNPATRRISGTFSFEALPASGGAAGTVSIANGSFTNLPYQ